MMLGIKEVRQAMLFSSSLAEDKSISNKILPHVHNQALEGRTSTEPATSWLRCKDSNNNTYNQTLLYFFRIF